MQYVGVKTRADFSSYNFIIILTLDVYNVNLTHSPLIDYLLIHRLMCKEPFTLSLHLASRKSHYFLSV